MSYNQFLQETPFNKNRETAEQVMSSTSRVPEEKAHMHAAYAGAEKDYKDGNVRAGDAKMEEGRIAAEQAKKEVQNEATQKANEYYKKEENELEKENPDMQKAQEYHEKGDKVMSDSVKKQAEIEKERLKAEEQAKAQKESYNKTVS